MGISLVFVEHQPASHWHIMPSPLTPCSTALLLVPHHPEVRRRHLPLLPPEARHPVPRTPRVPPGPPSWLAGNGTARPQAAGSPDFDENQLRLAMAAVAQRSYGISDTVNQALEAGWKLGVAHSMADGIISPDEEDRLKEFENQMALMPVPKPIPKWDVHFEGLEDYRAEKETLPGHTPGAFALRLMMTSDADISGRGSLPLLSWISRLLSYMCPQDVVDAGAQVSAAKELWTTASSANRQAPQTTGLVLCR